MKKLLIGIFVILVLLVAAVVTLPQLVPASAYKNKIEEQVSAALARDVTIAGDVKLKVFPSIVASAQTVTIANAAGFDAEPFAQMRSLDANVKLMPLLSRKIEIGAFTLTEPKIRLTRKKNGDVNWAFGAQDTKPKDSGPFQRDGRFSDMDISLGKFEISNGEITYSDQQSGQQTQLTAVNIDAAIPNLNAPVKLAGDLLFDSEPAKFSVSLDTPSAFLNGKVAPMAVSLEMNPADISINGQFLPGTEIGFDANVSAIVRDASALAAMAGQSNDALALANSGAFEGQLKYGKDGVTVSNANITAKGPALDARYTGDVSMHADTPRASGALSLNANDIGKITAALGIDVPQLAAVSSVSMTGDFKADGPVTRGSNIDLKVGGDGFDAQYSGGLVFDKVAVLDGEFSANAQSLPELPAKFGITDLPAALAALGSGSVRGKINGTSGDLRLSALDLKTESALISAAYRGSANVGKTQTLNGTFDATIPSMPKLAETADFKHPQIAALGALSVKGDVSGAPADLTLSNLDTRLSDGILNLAYQGGASVKGSNVQYNGKLGADITSLRKLASLSGGESPFPPSTDAGAIFERASVNGTAIGNLAGAKFSQADVKFDGMAGKGDFDVSLNGARPMIKGDLKIGEMDMRPYMAAYAAQNPTGKIRPWSEKPLDMTVLQSFDADLKASAESLNTGRMNMGSTDMTAKVSTGILTIDIPRAVLYGGVGRLNTKIDGRQPTTKVAMNFDLNGVDGKGFLGAAAGFTKLTGNTGATIRLGGAGRSQAEIMRGLNGAGKFELAEGVMSGVDIAQFVSGLDAAFKNRALPAGIGPSYTTAFSKLGGVFSVKNGVVHVGDFKLNGGNIIAEGAGQLDLGGQSIDFSLRPRLTEGGGLAGFGIPIRLKGGFGSVSAGLDTDLVGQIVAAKAKAKVQSELTKTITNSVGGDAGAIVGGLLGQGTPDSTEQPQSTDPVGNILGGILGGNQQQPANDNQPAEESEPEKKAEESETEKKEEPKADPLENALKDLFGGG